MSWKDLKLGFAVFLGVVAAYAVVFYGVLYPAMKLGIVVFMPRIDDAFSLWMSPPFVALYILLLLGLLVSFAWDRASRKDSISNALMSELKGRTMGGLLARGRGHKSTTYLGDRLDHVISKMTVGQTPSLAAVEDDMFRGLITYESVMERIHQNGFNGSGNGHIPVAELPAKEVMQSGSSVVLMEDTKLDEAMHHMLVHRLSDVAVVAQDGETYLGTVQVSDLTSELILDMEANLAKSRAPALQKMEARVEAARQKAAVKATMKEAIAKGAMQIKRAEATLHEARGEAARQRALAKASSRLGKVEAARQQAVVQASLDAARAETSRHKAMEKQARYQAQVKVRDENGAAGIGIGVASRPQADNSGIDSQPAVQSYVKGWWRLLNRVTGRSQLRAASRQTGSLYSAKSDALEAQTARTQRGWRRLFRRGGRRA